MISKGQDPFQPAMIKKFEKLEAETNKDTEKKCRSLIK